LILNYFY